MPFYSAIKDLVNGILIPSLSLRNIPQSLDIFLIDVNIEVYDNSQRSKVLSKKQN